MWTQHKVNLYCFFFVSNKLLAHFAWNIRKCMIFLLCISIIQKSNINHCYCEWVNSKLNTPCSWSEGWLTLCLICQYLSHIDCINVQYLVKIRRHVVWLNDRRVWLHQFAQCRNKKTSVLRPCCQAILLQLFSYFLPLGSQSYPSLFSHLPQLKESRFSKVGHE